MKYNPTTKDWFESRFKETDLPPEIEQLEVKSCPVSEFKYVMQSDGSMIVEGWVSTNDLDDGNDIVEPEAFRPVIDRYMKKPIVLFMHLMDYLPIGKTLSLEIVPGRGLKTRTLILPTDERGKDVIMLIKNGVLNSYSFMYWVDKYQTENVGEEDEVRRIISFKRLYEISIVNLGMNEEAIFEAGKRLNLKSFTIPGKKRVGKVDPELQKKLKEMEEKVAALDKQSTEVPVANLKKELEEIGKLQKTMQDKIENSDKKTGEVREFADRLSKDMKDAIKKMDDAIKTVNENRLQTGTVHRIPYDVKTLMAKKTVDLKRILTPEAFVCADEFRKKNDHILLVDAIAKTMIPDYAQMTFSDRIKTLSLYPEFVHLKATIDTATSGEGSEYLPVGYSSRMHNIVRQEMEVSAQHPMFQMTEASQVDPVEGADTIAIRATQQTTRPSTFISSDSQTPGSANKTWTAEKLKGDTQYSGEAKLDMIISVVDYIEMKLARSFKRAIEKASISGDDAAGSGYDTGDVPGSTDARYCWDGFRAVPLSTAKVDMGTWSEKNLNLLRSKGGIYFRRPNDFYYLTSLTTYLLHCLDPDEMPSFRTIDKYGPQATVAAGELGKLNGSALLTSEFVLDTYNATGIYDGVTMTKSIILGVNRESWKYGMYQDLSIEVIRNPYRDCFDVIGYERLDFKNVFDTSTEKVVVLGYNVSTS